MGRKIAFIHYTYPAGGAERISGDISYCLKGMGYDMYMFVPDLEKEKLTEQDKASIKFIEIPSGKNLDEPHIVDAVVAKLNDLAIDILVVPIIPLRSMSEYRKRTKAKVVFALHGQPFWEIINGYDKRNRRADISGSLLKKAMWYGLVKPLYKLNKKFEKQSRKKYLLGYHNSDAFTVLCPGYRTELCQSLGLDPSEEKIYPIHNFVQKREYDLTRKKKQVLCVGRLSYADKRLDRVLDVWNRVWRDFSDWELVIVGDGEERPYLERQVKDSNMGNVRFAGYTAEPWSYYEEASILALTSSFEGWGMVISEGQQVGVVPIAYGCSEGVKTQLEPDGVNGMLVPPFDRNEFEKKLRLLMSDDQLRAQMSRNVVEKAKTYDLESACLKWNALFEQLLK